MIRICGFLGLLLASASCSSHDDDAKDDDAFDRLTIEFSPMYSAFIDDDHPCSLPASVTDRTREVEWSASDDSMVELEPMRAGVMITTKAAGTLDIIARVDTVMAKALLTITPFSAAEWDAGEKRFHNGVVYKLPKPEDLPDSVWDDRMAMEDDGTGAFSALSIVRLPSDDAACDNCHGESPSADMRTFPTMITPEQVGGYSDDELAQTITLGERPARTMGSTPPVLFQQAHTFDAADPSDETRRNGIIAYLRSLAPEPQLVPYAATTPAP